MWCLVVFQHGFHGQYPPQVKEKVFLNDILCLKGRIYLRSRSLASLHGIARSKYKYYGAITKRMNFPSLKPVKALSQMQTTWS